MATATATMSRISEDIKLDETPQIIALRYMEGKAVPSRFPGGRAMFTTFDERKLFLNDDETSQLEHALAEQGIRPGEHIEVSRISHGRGGGFSIRVQRGSSSRAQGASVQAGPHNTPAPAYSNNQHQSPQRNTPEPAAPASPSATAMRTALCDAVDAIIDAQAYATRRGLGVTFSEESVRAIGLSIYIGIQQAQRGGGR
jgi:hypothetical protein